MGSTAQHTTLTCVCLFYESAHSLGRETCPLYRSLCCRAWHLLSEHLLAELPPCCHLCLCSVVPPPPPRPPAFTVPCDTPATTGSISPSALCPLPKLQLGCPVSSSEHSCVPSPYGTKTPMPSETLGFHSLAPGLTASSGISSSHSAAAPLSVQLCRSKPSSQS